MERAQLVTTVQASTDWSYWQTLQILYVH